MEQQFNRIRRATHAGSWYERNSTKLGNIMTNYLTKANAIDVKGKIVKGIIGPHAGYDYSGPTAAFSYVNINPLNYNRVFLLGPSHHIYVKACALPYSALYETPLGNIEVDFDIVQTLKKDKNFVTLKKSDEENEHSLEMHLPYIRKVFGECSFKLIPIMVGHIDKDQQEYYGKIFSEYLKDEQTLFIISSDFCHWGSNFDYQPLVGNISTAYSFIEELDKKGISYIENHDPEGFSEYLDKTNNTICGCYPILCYLYALKNSGLNYKTVLLNYSQSSQVKNSRDSSVSYAAILSYMD